MNKITQWILAGVLSVLGFAFWIWYIIGYAKDVAAGGNGGVVFNLLVAVSLAISGGLQYVRFKTWRYRGLAILVMVGSVVFLFNGISNLNKRDHKLYNSPLASEIAAATDQLNKSPPGSQSLEIYTERLKTIEAVGETTPEIKQALDQYTATLEEAVIALETRQDTATIKEKLTEEEKHLQALEVVPI